MFTAIISFIVSFLSATLLLRWKKWHLAWTADFVHSPQKIHTGDIPRIGGVGIFLGIFTGSTLKYLVDIEIGIVLLTCILACLPVFLGGFVEDITKRVNFRWRLVLSFIAGIAFVYLFNIQNIDVEIPIIDSILEFPWITMAFLGFAIAGLCNSYNIIDGINGLASMVGFLTLLAILYVSLKVGDPTIVSMAMIGLASIFGFFIWNYPKGLIFLGDGGAYLIGFWIAASVILLVTRNPSVSPWFALLINAYPVFETLFTIWRRSIHKNRKVMMPDGAHFHSLIYRRIMRWADPSTNGEHHYLTNAKTSPYLWLLSSIGLIPSVLFWNSTGLLMLSSVIFIFFYIYLYRKVVFLKKPLWGKNHRPPK